MAFAGALTILAMAPLGTRLSDRVGPLLEPSAQTETAAWLLGVTAAAKEPVVSFLRENASERERKPLLRNRARRPPCRRARGREA